MPRGPKRRTARLVLACLGLLLRSPVGRADPAPPHVPPLHVEYAAPGNCPTAKDFEAGVRARTTVARFADDPDAQSVHVVVRPTGTTYAGHLSIVSRSGHASERDVEDTLCSDVVDALALVTALAVDPNATLALPSHSNPTAPPAVAAPLDASSPGAATEAPTLAPGKAATAPPAPPLRAAPTPPLEAGPEVPTSTPAWGAGIGASFVTLGGIGPDALAGGAAFFELESTSLRVFAPSARVAVVAAENGIYVRSPSASFGLVGGRIDACPVRLGPRDLSIRPCLVVDAGALRAEGIDVTAPRAVFVAWLDVAAVLRARWAPGHGRFFVEIEGGILVPVTYPDFGYNNPNLTAPFQHQYTPRPGGLGSLGAGVRFW